jgi:hypothetical protein
LSVFALAAASVATARSEATQPRGGTAGSEIIVGTVVTSSSSMMRGLVSAV